MTGQKGIITMIFLSTLSLRRATPAPVPCRPDADISIHALLAESDSGHGNWCRVPYISIHALLAESDQPGNIVDAAIRISIHALLAESDINVLFTG